MKIFLCSPGFFCRIVVKTEYFEIAVKDKQIILRPVRITTPDLALEEIRGKMEKL
jgi:hypothetical protein